jgi:phage baseplate assembly protein W
MASVSSRSLSGVNRDTGEARHGLPHLRQSIGDIVSTPLGSRVMRPEYGSRLPRLVDLPVTRGWISSAQAEIGHGVGRWEPRIALRKCRVVSVEDGRVSIEADGDYLGDNVLIQVTV